MSVAAGLWGLPREMLTGLPGYGMDVATNRAEARRIMQKLGYGPDKPLAVKIATRNIPLYRDPAVMLIGQLKEIGIDAELDLVETANWNPKITRKDYMIGLENTGSAVDDPDQQFFEGYACQSDRNFTGYCNPELEKLYLRQSSEADHPETPGRPSRKHDVSVPAGRHEAARSLHFGTRNSFSRFLECHRDKPSRRRFECAG